MKSSVIHCLGNGDRRRDKDEVEVVKSRVIHCLGDGDMHRDTDEEEHEDENADNMY
ncbi:hypothetical protein RchiOBHm_Chr3g0484241 [Rosa chinensis]|uniref:Uncharacterized protein n=1 Tax=Rosa chinensis TaxID=74649 RepID=A0A2P6REQ3_ROSCH|nr:hypothetical protein RchiOBHm_Chr3g0484241 [Rosa chinensis]